MRTTALYYRLWTMILIDFNRHKYAVFEQNILGPYIHLI
jgi:hypothetical protein